MKKRLIAILIFACILCGVMCACEPKKKEITADEAVTIVMEDLGKGMIDVGEPHVHSGKYGNQDCYNVYITVNGEPWVYVVSTYGIILHKGLSNHSH